MSGFLLELPSPGATSAIVLGGLAEVDPAVFSPCRNLLWCVDAAGASVRPGLAGSTQVQAVLLDGPAGPPLTETIEAFLRRDPRRMPSVYVTAQLAPGLEEAYSHAIDEVHRLVEQQARARFTRQQDAFAWQCHLLGNLPAYVRRPVPADWAGRLQGTPAFIVGAGPSLNVSLPVLAAAAGQGVVFAADSALRALGRAGVTADFAVSIDVAKVPARCLPADTPVPGRVVLSLLSPPAWTDAVPPEQLFFVSGRQVTEDWVCRLGATRPAVAATESCGSTALELATFLGCAPLYFFGMDLAVDAGPSGQRHHRGVDPLLYRNSNYQADAVLPQVPGNYVAGVPCFAFGDWHELDARLAARAAPAVFNVTDRGARFRGTTLIHPERFRPAHPRLEKTALLAGLAAPVLPGPGAESALLRLRQAGRRLAQALPPLQQAFTQGGPAAVAEGLRRLVTEEELGQVLGSYALKLMPHLVPPIEGDRPFWQGLLDEVTRLAELADAVSAGAVDGQ